MLEQARKVLQHYYGYNEFRSGQAKVLGSLLGGHDTVAIMPTGAGKSLCYQIPALLLEGITLVVSPLISLMKDQVDALITQGIAATFINSSLSGSQTSERLYNIRRGHYTLIYIAPERLETEQFQTLVKHMKIAFVAIDEAHCVSQWGHDFRPSYKEVCLFIQNLPSKPLIGAFTATATPEVKQDIVRLLGLSQPQVHVSGFDRENLSFSVLRGENKEKFTLNYITVNKNQSGIIYAATRKTVDKLYEKLYHKGIAVGCYHAGMTNEERTAQQEKFIYDDIRVMVATNAFGMGIDKSNVRYVLHYNMPRNMEAYYQEAGRAGRDGEAGECILLFEAQDVMLQKFLIEQSVEEAERKGSEQKKLQLMVDYCHTPECQRKYILEYFGEKVTAEECGNCANCLSGGEVIDITEEAQKVLSCVVRMKERFGVVMVADVLRGSKNKKLIGFGLDKLSTYGILGHWKADEVKNFVNRLVATGYLSITEGEYPLVKLAMPAYAVLKNQEKVWQKVFKQQVQEAPENSLFEILRKLRKEIADREQVPSYIIFADSTLREMSTFCPADLEAMSQIKGVGQTKLAKYGEEFLAAIEPYAKPKEKKLAVNKNLAFRAEEQPSHVETLSLYNSGMSVKEIAVTRKLKIITVQDHLVRCSQEGLDVNWSPLIPPQYEKLILAAISSIGSERLRPLKEALPEEIDYSMIKAVICKHFGGQAKS